MQILAVIPMKPWGWSSICDLKQRGADMSADKSKHT